MSILEYNGAAMVAMVGEQCVAIASDLRLGLQAQTIDTKFQKIFPMTPKCYVGFAGLATDVQTLSQKLQFQVNMYQLREERVIQPKALGHLISSMLYEKRWGPYFVEPVLAGLDATNSPFICNTDLIGCLNFAKDFVVSGTCTDQLYGMCESLWEPQLPPEALFETISQSLVNAFDRDAVSGWGAVVHVITPEHVVTRHLRTRQD